MTRKRTRENLVQQLCEPCSYCDGRGYVISAESVAYKVLREIRKDLPRFCGRQVAVSVNPRVAEMLLGPARKATQRLSGELGREIEIRARPGLHQEQFEVVALDHGPPVEITLRWLEEQAPAGRRGPNAPKAIGQAAEPVSTEVAARATDQPGEAPAQPDPPTGDGVLAIPAVAASAEPASAVDGEAENPIIPRFQSEEL
jgi:hypothetical protein